MPSLPTSDRVVWQIPKRRLQRNSVSGLCGRQRLDQVGQNRHGPYALSQPRKGFSSRDGTKSVDELQSSVSARLSIRQVSLMTWRRFTAFADAVKKVSFRSQPCRRDATQPGPSLCAIQLAICQTRSVPQWSSCATRFGRPALLEQRR